MIKIYGAHSILHGEDGRSPRIQTKKNSMFLRGSRRAEEALLTMKENYNLVPCKSYRTFFTKQLLPLRVIATQIASASRLLSAPTRTV